MMVLHGQMAHSCSISNPPIMSLLLYEILKSENIALNPFVDRLMWNISKIGNPLIQLRVEWVLSQVLVALEGITCMLDVFSFLTLIFFFFGVYFFLFISMLEVLFVQRPHLKSNSCPWFSMNQNWAHDPIIPYKIPFSGELGSVFFWKTGHIYTKAFSATMIFCPIRKANKGFLQREREKEHESDMLRRAGVKEERSLEFHFLIPLRSWGPTTFCS